jgi:XTP/dITP diphosphohydrolase
MPELTLLAATSNRGKLAEYADAGRMEGYSVHVLPVPDLHRLPHCAESGSAFEENARIKAGHYSRLAGGLVFADDSGLEVEALDGAPGIRSARYSGPDATNERNNQKLLEALRNTPDPQRRARFVCVIALARVGKVMGTFQGSVEGMIGHEPRGHGGFGYDPLFVFPELGRTFAELTPAEKWHYSHRGRAFRAMLEWLAAHPAP